ncbi:ExeM/NucH family extracellular endonuclease [Kribbella sp. NPDC000426]|uniref:ExeM/NucH family extracellular endonuclease n=1 Tax=Kribbella sp. NPDC000426 TaxID=3154255 RepID=UPI003322B2CE
MTRRLGRLLVGATVGSLVASLLGVVPSAQAAGFAAGNIVVTRVGDGSGALSSAAAPVFLDEYTPAGTLVQTIPMPTGSSGANHRLTMSGSATSEGALALSADGKYLTLGGYDADPGTASVVGTPTTTVSRVVGRVAGDGAVDTTTAITDTFSGANVRGAVSDDGSRFWVVGSNGGVRLAPLGSSGATTQINSAAPVNLRVAGIAGGQLLVSTGSGTTGVYAVGSGLPVTGGQTPTITTAAPSPYGFVALDRDPGVPGVDTLYVADDSASPGGGVLKFSFDGTAWTAEGSFRPAGSGVRGLTGSRTSTGVTLFATTTTNALVKVDDTAAYTATISATATTLVTAATNTALRGVAFAPAGSGTTAPAITTQPQDTTVTTGGTATLTVAASGTGPLSYQWFQGVAPDTANPVGTGASFTTPALATTTQYWVRVSGPGGQVDSRTATVTVGAACSASAVTIGSVQGTTDISPVAGATVTIRGTVVADYEGASPALRGFYLQDAGDNNASTSDGIFVFDNGSNLVANGDTVQVTGPVSEFQGQTQVTAAATGVEECGTSGTVTPTDVTLPRASATDLEPYEGMLVRFHQTLTVTEHFQLGRFGQVVVSSGGRLRQPTADIRATDQAAVQAAQNANNLNQLIIDDATQAQNPDPIVFGRGGQPLSAANTLRGGDTVTDPVGVLTYTWAGNAASGNAYRLRPIGSLSGTAVFNAVNERPTAPPAVSGGIQVASANLLNFFNTFTGCHLGTQGGTTDCRGAQDNTEYQRQLAKEVASIRFLGAEVVGYMEMENDGYGTDSAVQALVDALNAADGPGQWAFVNPDAATGVVDVAGSDAIKAGLLYRTAAVQPVAGATFVDNNPLFERNPVAQTFQTSNGSRFTVVANHFKSKGSCPTSGPDTDQGDGQSCWNAHRTLQAQELASWIGSTVVPGAGDPDVLIVGDLNSYAGEDPIAALEAAGYVNEVKAFQGQEAYSYAFDGQWGYLDYALASPSLVGQVTGAGDAHHNADEPSVLDYNTDFKTAGQVQSLYAPDRFRTSDHDPVLVGLNLGTPATISGTPPAGTVGSPYSFAFTATGAVSLASGSLPPGLALASDGQISGTPTQAGTFAFSVRATNEFGTSADLAATITVAAAATTTTVTSSANPATIGAAIRFTATVSGAPTGGTVQFKVDGVALGSPVAVVNGVATSAPTSTLGLGAHAVTASFSGTDSYLASSGSLSQLVQYGVRVLSPTSGGSVKAGTIVPIRFQLVDAAGRPIPLLTALQLLVSGRITVSAAGAQSFPRTVPVYNPLDSTFLLPWKTAKRNLGTVTISITITYPGAPNQVVTIPIKLT